MNLKLKLISGFITVSSLVVILGAINIRTDRQVNRQFNQITTKSVPELIELDKIKVASLSMMNEALSYTLIQIEKDNEGEQDNVVEEEEKEEFEQAAERIEEGLSNLATFGLGEREMQQYQAIVKSYRHFYQERSNLLYRLEEEGRPEPGYFIEHWEEIEEAQEEFIAAIDRAIASEIESLNQETEKANQSAYNSLLINLGSVTLLLTISILIGFILAERITKPIITLKAAAGEIGSGELDTQVEIKTADEIEVLANSFNQMVCTLAETTVSKSYLDNIISCLSDGLLVLNTNQEITAINNTASSISGYSEQQLLHSQLEKLFDSESLNFLNSGLNSSQVRSFLGREETILYTKDGRQVPVSLAASRLEENGEQKGIVCLLQDISEQKRSQAMLRRQAVIFETITDGIIITDLEGKIIDWNEAAKQMFGYSKQEVLGKSINIIYPTREGDRLTGELLNEVKGKGSWQAEIHFRPHDRTTGLCEVVAVELRDYRGELVGAIAVHHDITERKQYENELVEAREAAIEAAKVKAQFLANMSHEIRTPMNGVLGMGELLLTTELTPQQLEFAQALKSSGEHLLTVINDILDFSKLEAGEMLLEKQDFNLNSCLEGVLDLCQTQAESKGLELGLLIDREVPRNLIGDRGRLRQVVTNLVSNGIKFTKTGGITIRAKISPHYKVENRVKILLEVEDTGIGIKQEDQDKLFKSFSQVDASITRQYGGTGLGLAISKQLVELMQGEIGLKSQEREGSTFWFTATFTLSSKTELAEVDPVTPLSKKILQGKRLLIVDDRPINRQVVRHQLSHLGMTVEEAANGEEALAAVENAAREGKPYDLALVDMEMPQMDGETLGKLVREQPASENIKLIMMSSLQANNKAQVILGSGFADYLVKPIKETKLIQSLLQVLHSSVSQESVQQEKLVFSQSSEKLKILLVEDTPMNLQLAFNQLKILGYEDVDSATNGKEALNQLMEREYDLVLMDCQMPILDGYETTQTLRQLEKSRHTIVVGMTAYAMTSDRQKCLDAGMDDYLSKPVAIKELRAVLERWSSSQQPQEEREKREEITIHPSPDIINWQKLEEIAGTDEKIQLQLLKMFINDATTYIEEVKAAISVKNWELIEKKAHQIKGISSSSAVESMATIAKEIEREAKARNSDLISRLVVELERVLDRAKSINNEQLTINNEN